MTRPIDANLMPTPSIAPGPDEPVTLDRPSLVRLLADGAAPALELTRIERAIARADYDDAAARCLARAKLALPVPAALIARVLVGVSQGQIFITLGRAAGPEIAPHLEQVVRDNRFGHDAMGAQQLCCTALLLESFGQLDAARAVLLPHLRMTARRPWISPWTRELLLEVARRLDDAHLGALCEQLLGPPAPGFATSVIAELMAASADDVIDGLRASTPVLALPGVPIRVGPKVGRNDPCACGSGKKYKKCCEAGDGPGAQRSSSYAQQLYDQAPHLTYDQIARLPRKYLAMLDLQRLDAPQLVAVMRAWARFRDYPRAARALDALVLRGGVDAPGHAEDLLRDALRDGHAGDVPHLIRYLDRLDVAMQLKLELSAKPEIGEEIERAALAVLRADPHRCAEIELAFCLLESRPALGILVARGALFAERLLDADTLVESIEEARDTLLLPPNDRAQASFEALGGRSNARAEREAASAAQMALAATTADLQQRLSAATGRIGELQQQVVKSERALQSAHTERQPSVPAQGAAPEELARLHGKVDELKSLLRERNAERADLRRQLEETTHDAQRSEPKRRAPSDDVDPLETEYDAPVERSVLIPRFPAAFEAVLAKLPRHVAADAVRLASALSAGDPASWRGVKQAKDMHRPVLMARVGIHHRLLFRIEASALEVTHLIARAELEQTLQRLRG